ncbi:MAG TPA: tetratricopeptide repeat protein, partial [Longimicrobium sp.]|nr:tetratricopeptide repeat protein [Longimicrobium sp.]
MRQRKFKAPQRKTQRRWRVPPALTHGEDGIEGLAVLDELPGESGLVLWQSLRDAMLWGRAPQAERAALFASGAEPSRVASILAAGLPAELETPLKVVAQMVGTPESASEESVSLACRQVSHWADAHGLLAVALAFMQAAAIVTPADAAIAYAVGRLARRRAEHARAETWYRRTIALARQSGDWPTYALAFVGLGNLYVQRGNFPAARRFHVRALRAANRNSLHEIEGMAQHDLFGIAIETGNVREAGDLARAAYEAYGPHHPRLPHLAHDVAYWWVTQGHFSRALPVLKLLRSHFSDPAMKLALLGDLGRAAGGVSEVGTFQEAWDAAAELFGDPATEHAAPRAYLDFAHGALSLGKWDRAEEAASKALDGATRRADAKTRLTAEALAEASRRHQRAQQQPASP